MQEFKSKRNKVFLENGKIVKEFNEKNCLDNEIKYLKLLRQNSVLVPQILAIDENKLELEYIEGTIFLDLFLDYEKNNLNCVFLIEILIDWLQKFYAITKQEFGEIHILKDVNLRNFLIVKDKLYGIDFELCGKGEIEKDIGTLLAFAIMYEPVMTDWKMNFMSTFLEKSIATLLLDKRKIEIYFENELENMKKRRK